MKPAEAYYLFVALKLHFTSDNYDYIKFNGKLKSKPRFELIKDKWQMNKFARQEDPMSLAIANMVRKPKIWVRDLVSDTGIKNYKTDKEYMENPVEYFRKDLDRLDDSTVTNFRCNGNHPLALRLYLGSKISPITLSILNKLSGNLFEHWNTALKDDIVAQPAIRALSKFSVFVDYDNYDNPDYLAQLKERFRV
jgi:hypothetical protein